METPVERIQQLIDSMDKKQCLEVAIYSAELVIDIFESKYPEDKKPRKAIEAAKSVLKEDTAKNRTEASRAAGGLRDFNEPDAASDAARVASWAAHAAIAEGIGAKAAAWVVASNARKEIQEKIIKRAVEILERGK